jgi:hypothetical protein
MGSLDENNLLQALDACRPGTADLAELAELADPAAAGPEFAEAARHVADDPRWQHARQVVEQFDRRVGAAIVSGPVPEGLADRILVRLRAAGAVAPRAPTGRSSTSRRRWLVLGGVAATAAAVMLAVHFWPTPPPEVTADAVIQGAIDYFVSDADRDAGRPLAEAPRDLPPGDDVVLPAGARWRRVSIELVAGSAVAYDVVVYDLVGGPRAARASLYVLRAAVRGLSDAPPGQPIRDTQGVCAAAWQVGDRVYVLVVEGGVRDYQRQLNLRTGTFT